jgi:predicted nucleic acid-binding protein
MAGVRKLRVYADTSVFGGCFDPEFRTESRKFFDEVRQGRFTVVISDVTVEELQPAPEEVRQVLATLPAEHLELVEVSDEAEALRQAYLEAGIVGGAASNDAAHIAAATVAEVDIVVSWNFKHIVHFEKIAGYEGVNTLRGFRSPRIYSPKEVVEP